MACFPCQRLQTLGATVPQRCAPWPDWMKDVDAAAMMLRLADDHDHLADRANKRANGERPQTAQYGRRLCRFVIASCVRHFCVFKLYGLVEVV